PAYKAELQEIKRARKATAAERRNRTAPSEQKARFYAELKRYAQENGKSIGWANLTYRAAFGVCQNAYSSVPPADRISDQTRTYLRSRMIAYARGGRAG